ncbi:MAG: sigma-54-dependent Fis family transcriptional regulator [Gammaproteobacteria bacterium]|nr:sigma-54-dependent Fis family transcriptional regulator [Gammaproteobacteria bacterium]
MTNINTDTLIGNSPELGAVLRAARLVAMTDAPVLIQGESGTGKELLAARVHRDSPRRGGPLITVNCAALPENLAESLLYGHRKGAFTGAVADHIGYIPQAAGGTLFLDEVGELPLAIQAKLLRFLESGECQPVGHGSATHVDVRIIAATNRDLAAEVAAGRFRQDLFYRLNVVPLCLPPLRTRGDDIALLLHHHAEQLARRYGLTAPRYSRAALRQLHAYDWPGNVRELRNLCERLVILCGGREITPENLPAEMRPMPQHATHNASFHLPPEGVRLDELEVTLIRQALTQTAGNRSRAARLLGLTRDTLLYRLKKYAID